VSSPLAGLSDYAPLDQCDLQEELFQAPEQKPHRFRFVQLEQFVADLHGLLVLFLVYRSQDYLTYPVHVLFEFGRADFHGFLPAITQLRIFQFLVVRADSFFSQKTLEADPIACCHD
jgi:hypothetical protein